jgi:uncharacterized protein (DUF1810 family)
MKIFISLICTFFSFLWLPAQDINALIKEADKQESSLNEKAAFDKFKEVLFVQPVNIYALNKCSELCSRIGKREKDPRQMTTYYSAAKTYASLALKLHPANAESNCVMAIALGRISLNKSGKEKIAAAKEIRRYVDIAIKNDPNNYKAWHVLGRWHFEMSSLNFIERAAVRLLFGSPPSSSIEASIAAFERAHLIEKNFVLNNYEMARAYYKAGQHKRAISLLTNMMLLNNTTEDDINIKKDGRKLLIDWQ